MAKTTKPLPVAVARQAPVPAAAQRAPAVNDTLLRGNKFYLSRSIPVERRRELRTLIQSNGGVLMKNVTPDAMELVENDALQNGRDWVSADFVYDSVRDQTMQDLRNYMACEHRPSSPQRKLAISVDQPKRKGRVEYMTADDARMFQFLENYRGKIKSMETVPLSVWKMAARINVTAHSGESMHEHYRKILKKYTPQERRNALQNAQAEENTRQRQELAVINDKAASRTAPPTSATPAAEGETSGTADSNTVNPQISETQVTPEPPVLENTSIAPTPELKSLAHVAEDDETKEDEEIQGRGKKRGRKSASADEQQVVAAEIINKEVSPIEGSTKHAKDSESPSAAVSAVTEVAPSEGADEAKAAAISTSAKIPVVSTRKQQKQKLKQTKPAATPPSEDEEDEELAVDETKEMSDSSVARKDPPGYYFHSRWEQLISDTGNRQRLEQFFRPLHHQRDVAPAPARGDTFRKAVLALSPAVTSSSTPASIATQSNGDTSGSNVPPPTTHQRKRAAPVAVEEQTQDEVEERVAAKPSAVALKKRKVRQASPPAAPLTSLAAVTPRQAPAPVQTPQHQRDEREEQPVLLVTSETEVDELTCQLQFQTGQDPNTVVHALYYSSGDVNVALSFLSGASVSGDFWSLEDDLLLSDDLVDEATDETKVVEARRLGAFASMHIPRTTAQILTRIRYLL